jgi:hypothetical protein
MASKKQRCEGKRRGFQRGAFGVFKCMRNAKGSVETRVGFTERHPCCGDDQCISSISAGYPAEWKPFADK